MGSSSEYYSERSDTLLNTSLLFYHVFFQIFKNVIPTLAKLISTRKLAWKNMHRTVWKTALFSASRNSPITIVRTIDLHSSKNSPSSRKNLVKELIYVTQRYEHRHDKLEVREHDVRTNTVYENYLPGRPDHLKGKIKFVNQRENSIDGCI